VITLKAAKGNFFDRQGVINATAKDTQQALRRGGANLRRIIKNSIKRPTKKRTVSKPGDPPLSQTGRLKDFVFYYFEPSSTGPLNGTVWVGPVLINKANGAPEVLEFGGMATVGDRTRRRYLGGGGEIKVVTGPPGREVKPGVFVQYAKLRSAAQVARANEINRQLFAGRKVHIEARPYLGPALDRAVASGKLPEYWGRATIGGG